MAEDKKPEKSKWGAEEIPVEEVEEVEMGDVSYLFPELKERIEKIKGKSDEKN